MYKFEFECRYCGCIYPTRHDSGKCPNCGAPGLRRNVIQLPDEPPHHPYFPNSYITPRYQSKIRQPQVWAYSTLGWWLTTSFLVVIAAILIGMLILALIPNESTYEGNVIPTVQAEKAFVQPAPEFSGIEFLSPRESRELRQHEDVIHLAVIGDGYGVRYATDSAVILDGDWDPVDQIFGVPAITFHKTAVNLRAYNVTWRLNKYQSFILADRPGKIYLIDGKNHIWEADFTTEILVSIKRAQDTLPITVEPNQTLSLTYK